MHNLFIEWLVQPMSLIAIALCVLLVVSIVAKWSSTLQAVALSSLLGVFLLVSSPIFANFLVSNLEGSRENPCWCSADTTDLPVVVLGGGKNDYLDSDSVYDILTLSSIRRVAGAAAIADDSSQFYLLGGGRGKHKEARLMASVLHDFGIAQDRIVQEHSSLSTAENARELAKIMNADNKPEQKAPRIALVTSSMHVPRASKTFEEQGFEVCHYATDARYTESAMPVNLLPYVGALSKTTDALHEYLGYFYYWLKREV